MIPSRFLSVTKVLIDDFSVIVDFNARAKQWTLKLTPQIEYRHETHRTYNRRTSFFHYGVVENIKMLNSLNVKSFFSCKGETNFLLYRLQPYLRS